MTSIFGQEVNLESRAMHVAPGGSVIYALSGACADIAKFLEVLREEVAYGMIGVKEAGDKRAVVEIYFGAADEDTASQMIKPFSAISCERSDVAEGEKRDGLSMAARNKVIDILRAV